jgi:hypothetical protein
MDELEKEYTFWYPSHAAVILVELRRVKKMAADQPALVWSIVGLVSGVGKVHHDHL